MEMNNRHDCHCICPSNFLFHGTWMADRVRETQELNKTLDIRSKVMMHVRVIHSSVRDQCCHVIRVLPPFQIVVRFKL